MSVDIDVRVPAGHFGAVDFEADQDTVSLDRLQDLMLGAGATFGVLASCTLSVLIFLN